MCTETTSRVTDFYITEKKKKDNYTKNHLQEGSLRHRFSFAQGIQKNPNWRQHKDYYLREEDNAPQNFALQNNTKCSELEEQVPFQAIYSYTLCTLSHRKHTHNTPPKNQKINIYNKQ
jgi:hypothetical protein